MSLAREIKDLAIALEALTRVPKSDRLMEDIETIIQMKMDSIRKETDERTKEDRKQEMAAFKAHQSKPVHDEIPF